MWHREVITEVVERTLRDLQRISALRNFYLAGGTEITKSANVSKGGFCFISERDYHLGQGLMATCPYDSTAPAPEVSVHIIHQQRLEGTNRKIYGVRYDATSA